MPFRLGSRPPPIRTTSLRQCAVPLGSAASPTVTRRSPTATGTASPIASSTCTPRANRSEDQPAGSELVRRALDVVLGRRRCLGDPARQLLHALVETHRRPEAQRVRRLRSVGDAVA